MEVSRLKVFQLELRIRYEARPNLEQLGNEIHLEITKIQPAGNDFHLETEFQLGEIGGDFHLETCWDSFPHHDRNHTPKHSMSVE